MNPNYNPNNIFKSHTWVRFAAGRTLVGYSASETEFNTIEKTGGAKTHTLTTAQMPAHSHAAVNGDTTIHFTQIDIVNGVSGKITIGSSGTSNRTVYGASINGGWQYLRDDDTTASTGGGSAHNNLQPYITVYFWKRTA